MVSMGSVSGMPVELIVTFTKYWWPEEQEKDIAICIDVAHNPMVHKWLAKRM